MDAECRAFNQQLQKIQARVLSLSNNQFKYIIGDNNQWNSSICLLAGIGIYPSVGHNEPGSGPSNKAIGLELFNEHEPINLYSLKSSLPSDWSDPAVALDGETIRNLDIPSVEHSDGFRSGMRAWNRTVQFWLANFIYRRTNRAYRQCDFYPICSN